MNNQNKTPELFVITRIHTGFTIHSTNNPFEEFHIRGDEKHATCTCKDYAKNHMKPQYQCRHIKVVHDMWEVPCDVELESFI